MPLYPFQEKVKKLIQGGKSVILQAPTGAGKTRAALSPFIENFFTTSPEEFPHKCVYSVPMRVLAHQFNQEYKAYAESYQRRFQRSMRVSIQTGDQPEDRRFERGDLIFCTIDQFLSSYLTMPYSLPARLANLNAGAMLGTYLIFDEFHLFDPGSTLPTVLYALKQLRRLAPMLLMTATFSRAMLDTLAQELEAEVVLVSQEEARQIETRGGLERPRQRTWQMAESGLDAGIVLDVHRQHSLVLCNSVRRAQALYNQLQTVIEARGQDIQVLLLHSRFLPEDRRRIENDLLRIFGKGASRAESAILVATQAIEVGVDITCEVLHSDLAPASALIQRAGRCARYPGEQGQVFIYPVENYAPYGKKQEDLWVQEMNAAQGWLQAHSGEAFDFSKEQEFVNAVAAPRDRKVLLNLVAGQALRKQAVERVLAGDRQGNDERLLVRDVDSRLVLVHPDPDQLLANPLGAVGFNLQPQTLYGMVKSWLERDVDVDWRVKWLVESQDADPKEDNQTEYGWKPLHDAGTVNMTRALIVNPELAGYSPKEGFLADRGRSGFISSLPGKGSSAEGFNRYGYQLETYEDHIRSVILAYKAICLPELAFPARALENAARAAGKDWPASSVLTAAWLACLFHDVGKLSQGWQGWAQAYQQRIGSPLPVGFAAAHTDNDPHNPQHSQAERAVRALKPHHAGEGALAVSAVLAQALGGNILAQAVMTAITRHHTPHALESEKFTLVGSARYHIQATLAFLPPEIAGKIDLGKLTINVPVVPNYFSRYLVSPGDLFGWLAYLLLARALRRADQEGTAKTYG